MIYAPLVSTSVLPLHPKPNSYWHADYQCQTLPSSLVYPFTEKQTDFLVIGGGYTGLSAAISLSEAGKSVTVIDAHALGFGCSGRNAGFVLSGSGRLSLSAIQDKWGLETATGMQQEFDSAVALLFERIERYNMQVDLVKGPYYKLAHTQKQAALLHASANAMNRQFNGNAELLSQDDIASRFSIRSVHGGVQTPGACVNPLKLLDEYARVALAKGAQLLYQTPALRIEDKKSYFNVITEKGPIRAKHILLATNAYTPKQFHSSIDTKHFPVQSSILVTAPLNKEMQQETGLNHAASFMDTRTMKYYYRVLLDGRLLFGGRGAVTGKDADNEKEKQRLFNAMAASFPSLRHIAVDHFWSGWVSVSMDSMPRIFTTDEGRIGYAMGYCGSGVSFSAFAGMRLAQRMLGDNSINLSLPLYDTPLPTYPLPQLRRLALQGLYQWAKIFEQ